ncbi:MAG: hypothetical protein PHE43_04270 [Candidatus Nanoarchaeia archaeon]|nr:hypothetical protein [Candidatus Nanoarchaeia archaeon]
MRKPKVNSGNDGTKKELSFRYPFVSIDREGNPLVFGINPEAVNTRTIIETGKEPAFILPTTDWVLDSIIRIIRRKKIKELVIVLNNRLIALK